MIFRRGFRGFFGRSSESLESEDDTIREIGKSSIESAATFEELYAAIRIQGAKGEIVSETGGEYDSEKIKKLISKIESLRLATSGEVAYTTRFTIDNITRAAGIRDKIRELLRMTAGKEKKV